MRNNETGEFELVMGNRQLLSGFFIVCLLFGVAFAMGYIVGRNSSPSARSVADMGVPAQAPVVMDSRPAPAGAVTQPPVQSAPAPEPPRTGEVPPPESPAPSPASNVSPASQPAPAAPVATQPAAAATGAVREPGSYWQVMAIKQPDAEIVMRSLKDKGFPAFTEPGPNNLFRVLVGPYNDRTALGKAKAELENAGFHTYLHKK